MTLLRSPIRSSIRSTLYNPLVGKWGNADPLGAWLLNATYADYDARKLDRMFQESTGQTAVVASADKVGLWLDGSQFGTKTLAQVIAGQPNICPLFPAWNAPVGAGAANMSVVGGKAVWNGSGAAGQAFFSSNAFSTTGAFVELKVAISAYSGTGDVLGSALLVTSPGGGNLVSTPSASVGTFTYRGFWRGASASRIAQIVGNITNSFTVDSITVKEIPGNPSLQTTSTQRLNLLISGSRYSLTADGTDDNLLSTYLAGAGANSILIDADVPASLAATQVIAGMSGSATARLSIGINTSGQLCAGVGSDANTTIVGTTDWRSTRLIAALSADGSTVKLLSATGEEYSAAQNGSPTTTIPARLAANNNNGTASSFYGGGIGRAILAQKALDLATFSAIRAQLLAS